MRKHLLGIKFLGRSKHMGNSHGRHVPRVYPLTPQCILLTHPCQRLSQCRVADTKFMPCVVATRVLYHTSLPRFLFRNSFACGLPLIRQLLSNYTYRIPIPSEITQVSILPPLFVLSTHTGYIQHSQDIYLVCIGGGPVIPLVAPLFSLTYPTLRDALFVYNACTVDELGAIQPLLPLKKRVSGHKTISFREM